MLKVVIIEDEYLIAERLSSMLLSLEHEIIVDTILSSVKDAISYLRDNKPDLIFLDINLSDDYCFNIFEEVNVTSPVIFVTAYSEYAIKAFEVNSIDYLLKPITISNLKRSLDKFQRITVLPNYSEILKKRESRYRNRFLVKYSNQLLSINIDDIAYFFSEDKWTFLCLKDGRKLPIEFSLKKIEDEVNPQFFFRINKKFLVSHESINTMHYVSKMRIRLNLKPNFESEPIFVAIEKLGSFKVWLSS
ncbi:LytTR family DNA-binding domain-containing protein [Flavobacterium sp.]|uniref:LytR/AlgR family response regulator transcription factor n=1 Tax=Flavobacterium sp. TaxID=239 RepID=UPI00334293F6